MNKLTRGKILTLFVVLTTLFTTLTFFTNSEFALVMAVISGLGLGVVIHDVIQTKHSLLRNYPLIGRLRWVFEHERSKIQQYFIEDDTNGTPYNREARSDVYQKAKGDINTTPFGTQLDVYEKGYEFVKHSLYPKNIKDLVEPRVTIGSKFCTRPYNASILNVSAMSYGALSDAAVKAINGGAKLGNFFQNTGEGGLSSHHKEEPRVTIGSKFCTRPYNASILNVSAMSYGALSDAAVKAINGGAKLGNFFQNTGEGGLSSHHKEEGADLCFQIGTGYFGAGKTVKGVRQFDEVAFKKNALIPQVKMIEIKLSQGAKPGHGGILPAKKNTAEIAEIRGVEQGVDVMSPPYHTAFDSPDSMLRFVRRLRTLSNGKPVGIKMCLGDEQELIELITHMKKINTYPDFITIDGGEGGTGAAPIVFTNSIGTPLVDALIFIDKQLKINGLRDQVKIIASGKASTSFDIIKLLALGADCVNAARAFMLSLGCIQARECNKNTCPVGIATQNPQLVKGLNPAEKRVRVYNYHKAVVHEVMEVMAALGVDSTTKLKPEHISVRLDKSTITTYKDLFKTNLY